MKYIVDFSSSSYDDFTLLLVPIHFKNEKDINRFKIAAKKAADKFLRLEKRQDKHFWKIQNKIQKLKKKDPSMTIEDSIKLEDEMHNIFGKEGHEIYLAKRFEWNGVFMNIGYICNLGLYVEPRILTCEEFVKKWENVSLEQKNSYEKEAEHFIHSA